MGITQSTRLRDLLATRQSNMVELLTAMVAAESPSHVPDSQQAVQKLIEAALTDHGFRVRRLAGKRTGGQLLAVPDWRVRGKPIQLLLGHCDTVWPLGTLEEMPVETRDGRLHGPGVYDMKAGLVQAIFAVGAVGL